MTGLLISGKSSFLELRLLSASTLLEAAGLSGLRPGLGLVPYLDPGESLLTPVLNTPIARLRGRERNPSAERKRVHLYDTVDFMDKYLWVVSDEFEGFPSKIYTTYICIFV